MRAARRRYGTNTASQAARSQRNARALSAIMLFVALLVLLG